MTELKTGLETVADAGIQRGRWREGGKLGQGLLQANVTEQLNVTFVFAGHQGTGQQWQAILVLCPDMTPNLPLRAHLRVVGLQTFTVLRTWARYLPSHCQNNLGV